MYSREVDIILRTVFAALICADFAGNILVCLVVRRFPFMKTPMNYLLVHLAVCDMLVGLFLFPRHVLFGLYEHPDGLIGDLLCKFITFGNLAWPSSCASVLTLVLIAWERYNAILKPHSNRMSQRFLKYALGLSWIYTLLISGAPTLVAVYHNPVIKSCDFQWMGTWGVKVDACLWLFAVFVIPFLIMVFLYGRVIRSLWLQGNNAVNVSQRSLQMSRKSITRTSVTITAILFICFTPNTIFYFILVVPAQKASADFASAGAVFHTISHVLILLNSSINPVIYALQSTRFRRCMGALLCKRLVNKIRIKENSFNLSRVSNRSQLHQA